MNLRRMTSLGLSVLFTLACATSYTPNANTRSDLIAYVERAADLVEEQGLAACPSFSKPAWKEGDYYIFISRAADDVVVCHPVSSNLVGASQSELRDADGKYFVREMAAAGRSPQGRGWVEYRWPRPGMTTPEPKSAYVVAVAPGGTRYLVGSGGYNMPSGN